MKKTGLYLHIPFCERKCHYCDFYSVTDKSLIDAYIDALTKEIERESRSFVSVYIGGGSPSILSTEQITKIFSSLSKTALANCEEITIEANPSQISEEKLKHWLNLGATRISIGAQSFNDNLLKSVGRIHTAKQAIESVNLAKKAGFDNISLDLIYGLPNETLSDLLEDIKKAAALSPTHISAYALTVEENTYLYKLLNEKKAELPSDKVVEEMYDAVNEILPNFAYNRYEISNFAKSGYECKHNLLYWTDANYLGLGVSAASFIDDIRYKNNCSIKEYIEKINNDSEVNTIEKRTKNEAIFEYIFLALRKTSGLSENDFNKKFDANFESMFEKELTELENLELLKKRNNQIYLTEKGLKVSNMVFEKFIK